MMITAGRNFTLVFFLLCSLHCSPVFAAVDWAEIKGEHFIVYYERGNEEFAESVAAKGEEYYNLIAEELGYMRYSNFWKWSNRVKIYIYPDHDAYLRNSGQKEWSHGMADYRNKRIVSYAWGEGFLDSLLPHEIGHLIFRDFVGFQGEVPLWLDEGVAQWGEKAKRNEMKLVVMQLVQKNLLLSLDDLTTLDVRNIQTTDMVHMRAVHFKDGKKEVLIVDSNQLVRLYYMQAFSLVGFLVERYGADNFVIFCRQLRDGKNIEDALKFTYPTQMRSIAEMEEQWRKYLQEELEKMPQDANKVVPGKNEGI